jgi:hypothetical protein
MTDDCHVMSGWNVSVINSTQLLIMVSCCDPAAADKALQQLIVDWDRPHLVDVSHSTLVNYVPVSAGTVAEKQEEREEE